MKTKLLSFTFLLISICFFSTTSFAQTAPGDDGSDIPVEGGGTLITPYTYSSFTFKRNNGNGNGVCGDRAQIRVVFDPMPPTTTDIPKLSAIWYQGTNLLGTRVSVSATTIISHTQPYVSYCLTGLLPAPGASGGNIPPAEKLTLEFSH
ncbi:MAG: hypothetical protein ACR2KX_18905 [Chitinophagaceae bacterium]